MNTNYELRSPCAALITTAFELPGFQIVKSYGIVRGIIVRSRSVIGNIGAVQLGANAVIGMRYDATEIAAGITEVLCYGTAVTVQPV
jgi:uncharacterized protein YbjQ (UPF0145 family)